MKKLPLLILSSLFGLIPLFTFGHGNGYLQFNPDSSNSLRVADVDIPSQVFFAQNDFLGGIDLWLANPGEASSATFALLNEQGSILTSRTVNIPTIAETTNGTRFHIDFNSQLSVLADTRYSIRITSAMPELRLYYSDRVQLISYNAPFTSEYITGVGRLGSEEQVFSFKYTLYETNEISAPIISNVSWTVISSNEMRVDFNANEPIDYRIEYGSSGQGYTASTNFIGDYLFCATDIATCKLSIYVLPNTTYQYRLTAKDSWGNQSQMTGTFLSGQSQAPTPTPSSAGSPSPTAVPSPTATTASSPTSTPDTVLPSISNLRVAQVTDNSVSLAWTTNKIANSYVLITREIDFSLVITSVLDSTLELEHLLTSGNVLGPSTTYFGKVTSTDSEGNESIASISFTTLSYQPIPIPTPTPSIGATPTGTPLPTPFINTNNSSDQGGSGTVVIRWGSSSAKEPSDGYRIDVFDKDGKLVKSTLAPSGSHELEVLNLSEGEYSVIVYENNDGVFKKVDKPAKLKVGDESFVQRLLVLWPYLSIAIGLIAGLLIWRKIKSKPSQITTQVLPS